MNAYDPPDAVFLVVHLGFAPLRRIVAAIFQGGVKGSIELRPRVLRKREFLPELG